MPLDLSKEIGIEELHDVDIPCYDVRVESKGKKLSRIISINCKEKSVTFYRVDSDGKHIASGDDLATKKAHLDSVSLIHNDTLIAGW